MKFHTVVMHLQFHINQYTLSVLYCLFLFFISFYSYIKMKNGQNQFSSLTLFYIYSLHWNKRTPVSTIESRISLQKLARSVHELYICRWQLRNNMDPKQNLRFKFSAKHSRSHWLCHDKSCRCWAIAITQIANHPRTNALQVECVEKWVCLVCVVLANAHNRIASIARHFEWLRWNVQQLQFVSR
jgi:hypothetical protein